MPFRQNDSRPMGSSRRHVPLVGSELRHVAGARGAGGVNPNEVIEVTLFVRKAKSAVDPATTVRALARRRVRTREYMSRSRYAELHGADPADLEKIEAIANEYNLTVAAISPAQRSARLVGSVNDFARFLNVQFAMFQSPQGAYRGYNGTLQVPDALTDIVEGVFGVDNKPQSTYHLRKAPRAGPRADGLKSYTPAEVANLYNFPAGFDGSGQCVGIIEFGGGYRLTDLNTYFQSLGIPTPKVVAVSVGLGRNFPTGPNSADDEVMLDIEVVGAVAPGAQIVVYFAPNTSLGWWRAIHTAISDSFHNPSVISISWGGPEETWSPQLTRAINAQFQAAAAMGITICTAAGDQGFTDGVAGARAHVDFPASSPLVLACGGTRIESSGGKISAESVWNDSPSSSTGGGVSAVFDVPDWQKNVPTIPASVSPPYQKGRGVPDVAGNADPVTGYQIRVDGQDFVIGGTSAVAPLWAGLLARINQKLGAPLGFVNELLYQAAAGGGFNDIVTGNNGAGGYQAGPGWDACTGMGTPNGTALSELLDTVGGAEEPQETCAAAT